MSLVIPGFQRLSLLADTVMVAIGTKDAAIAR
jgi:hypothetical protein